MTRPTLSHIFLVALAINVPCHGRGDIITSTSFVACLASVGIREILRTRRRTLEELENERKEKEVVRTSEATANHDKARQKRATRIKRLKIFENIFLGLSIATGTTFLTRSVLKKWGDRLFQSLSQIRPQSAPQARSSASNIQNWGLRKRKEHKNDGKVVGYTIRDIQTYDQLKGHAECNACWHMKECYDVCPETRGHCYMCTTCISYQRRGATKCPHCRQPSPCLEYIPESLLPQTQTPR